MDEGGGVYPPPLPPKSLMAEHPSREPRLCLIGRVAQRLGCLPKKFTSAQVYYPITIRPLDNDSDYGYDGDIKYNPGMRVPPPQQDEPKPQMPPHVATYQYKYPQLPTSPKNTPVVKTVSQGALPLSAINALQDCTPETTCVTLNPETELPQVHSTGQIRHTPYLASLSAIPQGPYQNPVPDSILQELGNILPTQYTWNTPSGVLTYTPAPSSTLLPNSPVDRGPWSPHIVDLAEGNDGPTGLGLIPAPISSDTSDSSSVCLGYGQQPGVALNPFLASNCFLPLEWNVSEPVETVAHALGDASITTHVHEPATNPPATTLHIELCFIDGPKVKYGWEPINIRKCRPIRIVDVFHSIHNYFEKQLTHAEWDIIKSHGKHNSKIVRDSWLERINLKPEGGARSAVYIGGLRRVDCLGSSRKFVGLWVDGSQLKLGLRA